MAASSTWPADWASSRAGVGCPMCADAGGASTPYGERILAGRWSDAYLGRHPLRPGYAYVIWKGRHVAEPTELDADESAGFWSEVTRVAEALEDRYQPAKMNWMALGNGVPHLHVHLVPRPFDDPAPGLPVGPDDFTRSYARPMDEERLSDEAAALRKALGQTP